MKTRKPTDLPKSLKTIDVKAILRKRGVYLTQRVNREMKEAAIPLARAMIEGKQKTEQRRHPQFTNEDIQAYWEKQVHIIDVLEKRFETKVEQFVLKVVDGFLKTLESEVNTQKALKKYEVKDFFDNASDDLITQAQFDFTPLLMDQAVLAGQEAYKLLKHDDIYTPYQLRDTISRNVTKFTQSLLDTDRDTLVNIIQHGIESGQSMGDIRNQIQLDFQDISKNQAMRITRTEVARASNQATIDAYEQSGVVEGKQWVTFGASDECEQYDGEIVYDLKGNFYSDTDQFKDGDPPLHPNCRCIVVPIVTSEKVYVPKPNKALYEQIKQLEAQLDKRTKEFKEIKALRGDDLAYIKALEGLINE